MFEELRFAPSLGSDNHSGAHPRVMEAVVAANRGHAHAYGMDEVCELTAQEFKRVFGPEVEAHFVFTGTAANVLCMSPFLRSFEAVICADQASSPRRRMWCSRKILGRKTLDAPFGGCKIQPDQCADFLHRVWTNTFRSREPFHSLNQQNSEFATRSKSCANGGPLLNPKILCCTSTGPDLSTLRLFLAAVLKS